MPSVRPVMMYMYISDQLMSTTSSFRLNRLRQEEKKNILTGFRCLRFVTRSLYLERVIRMEKEIILCFSTFPGYVQVQLKTLQTFQIKYFEIQ